MKQDFNINKPNLKLTILKYDYMILKLYKFNLNFNLSKIDY
jgi:hypothetical protein